MRKILALVVTLAFIMCSLPVISISATTVQFAGGSGTEDDPYLIETKEHLNNVRNNLSAHYRMIADIEFADSDFAEDGAFYNNGQGWDPIGVSSSGFTGTFDGDGYSIRGLKKDITANKITAVGLFGYSAGTIYDLSVVDADYTVKINDNDGGNFYVGGVVGYQSGGEILNCFSSANINATTTTKYCYANIGGIVGYLAYADLSFCEYTGTIYVEAVSSSYVGGICGRASHAISIVDCKNSGAVSGGLHAGGIVGEVSYTQTIYNCVNEGDIGGTYYTGGICGYTAYEGCVSNSYNVGNILSASTVTANSTLAYSFAGGIAGNAASYDIYNCYNAGQVEATVLGSYPAYAGGITGKTSGIIYTSFNIGTITSKDYAAGICGEIDSMNGGDIENCYYLDACAKGVYGISDTATKCTIAQMADKETYTGFDFDTVWNMNDSVSHPYPELISLPHIEEAASEDTTNFDGGDGTPLNPYKIKTKYHLDNVRRFCLDGQYFVLVSDIIFDETDFAVGGDFYNDGNGWNSIGENENSPFIGVLDGCDYTISGLQLNITSTGKLYAGLFGYCQGNIKNLNISNASISGTVTDSNGACYIGGITGYLSTGTIENCSVSGEILAHDACSESIDKATAYAGGIVGEVNTGSIVNCQNTASVTAYADSLDVHPGSGSFGTRAYAGGITAKTSGAISNSYNTGDVNAEARGIHSNTTAGGIVATTYSDVSFCYNTANVSALGNPNNVAGGIAGNASGILSNAYNTGTITSAGNVGGLVGASSGKCISTYNVGVVYKGSSYYCYAGGIIGYGADATVESSYYLNDTAKGIGKGSDTATACNLSEMADPSTYNGFDFEKIWMMSSSANHPFPELIELPHVTTPVKENTIEFAGGTGSALNPYKISTKEHLNNVRNYLGANYILLNNIVFSESDFLEGGSFYNDGAGFEPIGTERQPFTGNFNGNGKRIMNLRINIVIDHGSAFAGLFGYNSGKIYGLGMHKSKISLMIVGTNDSYVNSTNVGGIVGYNEGLVDQCYNAGDIYSFCEISQVEAGGIAGYTSGVISNCYNAGKVEAQTNATSYYAFAGGIVGTAAGGQIQNCYNVGIVVANGQNPKPEGIAGHPYYSGITNNCYFLDNITTTNNTGQYTFDQMQEQDAFVNFDFDTVWTMIGHPAYPYPELQVLVNSACGDVNDDLTLDTSDAREVLRFIVGVYNFTDEQKDNADFNLDGKINTADAREILRVVIT